MVPPNYDVIIIIRRIYELHLNIRWKIIEWKERQRQRHRHARDPASKSQQKQWSSGGVGEGETRQRLKPSGVVAGTRRGWFWA